MMLFGDEYFCVMDKYKALKATNEHHEIKWKFVQVYKLFCKDPNVKDFFIGSTNSIQKMLNYHNMESKRTRFVTRTLYKHIQANGGFINFSVLFFA